MNKGVLGTAITVVVVISCIAAVLWWYQPRAAITDNATNTGDNQFGNFSPEFGFGDIYAETGLVNTYVTPTAGKELHEVSYTGGSLSDFLALWQGAVTQATSAQVAVLDVASTTNASGSGGSKVTYEAQTNLGDILERMNAQFRAMVGNSSNESLDDAIYNLVYNTSSVDLGDSATTMSATASELHDYGNELAQLLTSFQNIQGDQAGMLDSFFTDTSDTNRNKVLALAKGYNTLAKDVAVLQAPESARTVNDNIATALTEIASKLDTLANTSSDEDMYDAVLVYNTASAQLAKATLTLIDLFKFEEVTFNAVEPGSVFMFK